MRVLTPRFLVALRMLVFFFVRIETLRALHFNWFDPEITACLIFVRFISLMLRVDVEKVVTNTNFFFDLVATVFVVARFLRSDMLVLISQFSHHFVGELR